MSCWRRTGTLERLDVEFFVCHCPSRKPFQLDVKDERDNAMTCTAYLRLFV
jgi:hypothetical protein